jgi:hypothetical protein
MEYRKLSTGGMLCCHSRRPDISAEALASWRMTWRRWPSQTDRNPECLFEIDGPTGQRCCEGCQTHGDRAQRPLGAGDQPRVFGAGVDLHRPCRHGHKSTAETRGFTGRMRTSHGSAHLRGPTAPIRIIGIPEAEKPCHILQRLEAGA